MAPTTSICARRVLQPRGGASILLSPTVAGLLGAAIGASATGVAAMIQARAASARERRARLFDARRSIYASILKAFSLRQQRIAGDSAIIVPASNDDYVFEIEILGSERVYERLQELMGALDQLLDERERLAATDPVRANDQQQLMQADTFARLYRQADSKSAQLRAAMQNDLGAR